MSKDPAFLFYPNDWIGGTMGMTFEEKGCYMELLMMQFNHGKFTEAQAKQVLSICFDVAWANIKHKFKTDGTYYWNVRLKEERERRQKFTESRRSNASNPKKTKASAKHMLEHMEDEDETVTKDVYRKENHLSITWDEFNKLVEKYGREESDNIISDILNYSKNSKYKSLYLTAIKWLDKQNEKPTKKLAF